MENIKKEERLKAILSKYKEGPLSGIFTDGSAIPNPGPGGWGVVYVENNAIVTELSGHVPETTNNRMELTALIEAYTLAPNDKPLTLFSDSELCVKTVNEWAKGWEARGWKRKSGPIQNLELVRKLYELSKMKPLLKLNWIKAHNGWRWNEYADTLFDSMGS